MLISILKFTGMLILLLLLLIVFILILLLFVPFRYELDGSYIDEVPNGQVRLSWLMHFLSLELNYHDGVMLTGDFRIMGICIYKLRSKTEAAEDKETTDLSEELL